MIALKPILISVRRQKIEMVSFLVCFALAYLADIISIILWDGSWKELYSVIGYVLALAVLFYIVWSILRLAYYLILLPFRRKA